MWTGEAVSTRSDEKCERYFTMSKVSRISALENSDTMTSKLARIFWM